MGGRGASSTLGGSTVYDGREVDPGRSVGREYSSPAALRRTLESSGYDVDVMPGSDSWSGEMNARFVRSYDVDEEGAVHTVRYQRSGERNSRNVRVTSHRKSYE